MGYIRRFGLKECKMVEIDLQGFHGAAREALLQRIAAVIHEERQKLMERAMKHPGKKQPPLDPQGAKSSSSNDSLDKHRGMKKAQPRKFG